MRAMRWSVLFASLQVLHLAAVAFSASSLSCIPDPGTPLRLLIHADLQPICAGFIDPTLPPYNATGDGVADDKAALQSSIDDAYSARMTVRLPANRTFACSGQLRLVQTEHSRAFGYHLVGGSPSLSSTTRPVLRLMDGSFPSLATSTVSTKPTSGKAFVLYQLVQNGTVKDPSHYNSRLRGIDIDLGDNPGASGVTMSGAQLCSIEDVRISGRRFFAGVEGLPGSGGFTANLEVLGGLYGIVQPFHRPNPSVAGLVLTNQSAAGIVIRDARGPLVVSGFQIESGPMPGSAYRAVLAANGPSSYQDPGDVAFNGEDGSIFIHHPHDDDGGGSSRGSNVGGVAVETRGGDVALKNVFFKGAATLVASATGASTRTAVLPAPASSSSFFSSSTSWCRVPLFVFTKTGGSIADDGKLHTEAYLPSPGVETGAGFAPPAGSSAFPTLHSWTYPDDTPTWEDHRALNVVADYGATPQWVNSTDDDGARIQRAINDACNPELPDTFGAPVFIPHGEFHLQQSLDLRGCGRLVGAGTHSSALLPLGGGGGLGGSSELPCWPMKPGETGAVLVSSSTATPGAVVALGPASPSPSPSSLSSSPFVTDISIYANRSCPFLDFSAGTNILLRDVGTEIVNSKTLPPPITSLSSSPSSTVKQPIAAAVVSERPDEDPAAGLPPQLPFVTVRGGQVSGKFFGLSLDHIGDVVVGGVSGPRHVLLLVSGTGSLDGDGSSGGSGGSGGSGVHFYQPSTEHLVNDEQVLVERSRDVHFHAWKYESQIDVRTASAPSGSLARISGSTNVTVFGGSGNYGLSSRTRPVLQVADGSTNITVVGMVRKPVWQEPSNGLLWLADDNPSMPLKLDAYHQLLFYHSNTNKAKGGRGGRGIRRREAAPQLRSSEKQPSPPAAAKAIPFSSFTASCELRPAAPLWRFYGSRPHPDLSMISSDVLWRSEDKNLAILPRWRPLAPTCNESTHCTVPFVDTHVAVRFLGGVSNYSTATAEGCTDGPGSWCDLVVRRATTDGDLVDGDAAATPTAATTKLVSRFDLVDSRLGRFVAAGMDVMVVLDNVPWAFVNVTDEGPCQTYGCQYLPPDDPQEFAAWVGELASYVVRAFGRDWASRVRWRLGTEANGPRWTDRGKYYDRYLESYRLCARAIRAAIPSARLGASNWVEVVGASGNLTTPGGSDAFQAQFYAAVGASTDTTDTIPLDWVSMSHYGGPRNFPGADYVQRTPYGNRGEVELDAMRDLARRPNATREVMEWSVLSNDLRRASWEPSALGSAWTAASATAWLCRGVDQIFHWQTGATVRNSTGDNRIVNFYEQMPWNMALLELFLGGRARFLTYDLTPDHFLSTLAVSATSLTAKVAASQGASRVSPPPAETLKLNGTVAVIESVLPSGEYLALVAALGPDRQHPFRTTFPLTSDAVELLTTTTTTTTESGSAATASLDVRQWRMNSSVSVVETVLRELRAKPNRKDYLLHDDNLPYDFRDLLTSLGLEYVEKPENLDRYWKQHAQTFQPSPFEGTWEQHMHTTTFHLDLTAPSVTVISAKKTNSKEDQ